MSGVVVSRYRCMPREYRSRRNAGQGLNHAGLLHTMPVSVWPGMMPRMFNGLYDVGWSSMQHAYGSVDEVPALLLALRSTDAQERSKALSRFYGVARGAVAQP
jgi:hypothetical protein